MENLKYFNGDALKLPFENNSFDSCISTTVIEHIPNEEFLKEQYRVCKKNGNVTVVYFRPDKSIKTGQHPDLIKPKREEEIWNKLIDGLPNYDQEYNVAKYWPKDSELPKLFDLIGFKDVRVDAIAIPEAIDDSRNKTDDKLKIIENMLKNEIDTVDLIQIDNKKLSTSEIIEIKSLIKERYDKRRSFIEQNVNIWDFQISLMQIVSGRK